MMRATVMIMAALMLSTPAWAGDVYRWVDDQGNVHYSENPPPGAESEQMDIRTGRQMPETRLEDVTETPEQPEETEETDQAEGAQEPRPDADAVAEARRRNCETAREALQTLDQHNRVQVEEDGERRFLTPDEVAEQRARYEEIREESCE